MTNKIIIIGAGLTGLYLGYLLKMSNIDFEIYDKSNRPGGKLKSINLFNANLECGMDYIESNNLKIIELINKLNIRFDVVTKKIKYIDIKAFNYDDICKKIRDNFNNYNTNELITMNTYIFLELTLNQIEFEQFKQIIDVNLLEMNIREFMQHSFNDIYAKIQSMSIDNNILQSIQTQIQLDHSMQTITDRLAVLVQEKLNLNHFVQEITYMPLTHTYMLMINNSYVQVDKLVLACNSSIKTIKLNIPRNIKSQISNIKSFSMIKLFILFNSDMNHIIKSNEIIYTKSILTNITICPTNSKIINLNLINNSKTKLLFNLLSSDLKTSKYIHKVKKILHKILSNIFNQTIPTINNFAYCKWTNGYHINLNIIQTNFWNHHNLILTGEWVNSWTNTLEGACVSAIDTYHLIKNPLYFDKLRHVPDNVKSINQNIYK